MDKQYNKTYFQCLYFLRLLLFDMVFAVLYIAIPKPAPASIESTTIFDETATRKLIISPFPRS